MIVGVFKVSGHSMLPQYPPGCTILISTLPYLFSHPKKKDVIVFKKDQKIIIKRIVDINDKKIYVSGDNKNDSMYFEPFERNLIIGKVIFKM